ncbi:MAG: ABC transporter substrate-binding protein [Eubacteriales bacterium]|nr:ABC transporter substrate-binding protein [Eubacteriales bacterium]
MKKNELMKMAAAVMTAGALMAALTACGGSSSSGSETAAAGNGAAATEADADAGTETGGEELKVGIIQMIENGAFNDMREGFIEELRAKGYDEDRLVIDYKNAQGDASNLQTIAQGMADGSYDLVATIATPATQAMVNTGSQTPVIFVAVSSPLAAGVISDMEHPDKNATGTSNAIPVGDIFDLSSRLTPDAKTFGFLYCTSEINSVSTVEAAKEYCDANGIAYREAVVTNSSEVQQAAQSLAGEVDAIFIPNDSVIQSAMTLVSEVARDAKIPVYASSATTVASGAFATIAVSDKEIGARSADMAVQYFEGTEIAEIPAVVVPASATVVNSDAVEALGITLPEDETYTFVKDAE